MIQRFWVGVLLIFCFALPSVSAQDTLQAPPVVQPQAVRAHDCRMDASKLRPILQSSNPYTTSHTWDDALKHETARMGMHTTVVIEQRACLRHHIDITIIVAPAGVQTGDVNFGLAAMQSVLDRIFYLDPTYLQYRSEMVSQLTAGYQQRSGRGMFTFPVADRSFIASFETGGAGTVLRMEVVRMLHTHQLRMPGIPEKEDDGYYKAKP